jgi:tetratricopeptide (TPR) repeat protein
MPRWVYFGLLLVLSSLVWAQQKPAPSTPPPASSSSPSSAPPASDKQDASGLSRDLSFPEDDPANPAPANDPAKNGAAKNDAAKKRAPSMAPPRSDRVQADDLGSGVGTSSSKDTQVDLSAPADDTKTHPQSSAAVADAEATVLSGGVSEFHTWDPHKAAKSVEVGDFYFKRKNYRAAEDRYREALRYKDNDAAATMRLAVCLEKLGILDDARAEYESYLKILPYGPQAVEAQKALDRLKAETAGTKQ